MIDLVDPVQRHIAAIVFRDTVVADDASDMASRADASPKQVERQLRALLPGVDFPWGSGNGLLDDPVGRRVGRAAFNSSIRALWSDGVWTVGALAPHRLPEDAGAIARFIREQTLLGVGDPDDASGDDLVEQLLGFSITDHARISDVLRTGGWRARLFVAASMIAAACASYQAKRHKSDKTGRNKGAVELAALGIEAAVLGAARIATDIYLSDESPVAARRIAMMLTERVERFRRARATKTVAYSINMAANAAEAIHIFLTRGTTRDIPPEHDRDPRRLPSRLATRNPAMETAVQAMIEEVTAVDAHHLYCLLMARRLDVALSRHRWLAAPHPIFRLSYAYIGGHAAFAEFERLGVIIRTMADRERELDGQVLTSTSIRPVLAGPQETESAIRLRTAAGRYLDLGAYHRAVTTSFIRRKAHLMRTTVPSYTHHAYASGTRICDLAVSAADHATHDFIRRSELDKPTERGVRANHLVLFYGLDVKNAVILAVRQITDRLSHRGVNGADWRVAFGLIVHRILSHAMPTLAVRLAATSSLRADEVTCKGLVNRASHLASQFDDHDFDRPCGAFFDYALWFDRDRDVAFWDRLQKGAKLYGALGSLFVPPPAEREALPGRQGRRSMRGDALPSRWQQIMLEAKKAIDAYHPLYVKSHPTRLTARIMARMNQGYSAFSSDPQFCTIFKN
ncbi:hypothetical protein QLH51_18670 [Sphingomonas sp. 2R-10]|uniref:hypothetical protein n=1 Tax=Sphingomonas sp. 2R-10 TaxID=3045148 RepID=UPI000F798E68|nr:hypothetical protein [Sphingomonas sp. 2R-10]MDJ0278820.1 hypothetical protein [Sphingomonas sp. 2R-10]